ncbi:MAG: lysophospholipid acyltransferase family protein [Marinicellaceae bacterium]
MNFKKINTNILVGFSRLISYLPIFLLVKIGAFVGFLTWLFPNKRKKIAARNLKLCFPNLSRSQHNTLLKKNLISTGIGLFEMIMAFWSSDKKLANRVEFNGFEHLENALSQNKGCILLSCHLHSIEINTRLINLQLSNKGHMLARQHNNKIFEKHIDKARRNHCELTIDKKDVRTVLKSLKKNHPVYYVPDQNFSYQCEFVEFFGQPAATVIAPVRIAQISKSPVIPWFGFREKDKTGKIIWKIHFYKPLEYFQEKEVNSCLLKMNQLFEKQILKYPEQYLWVHRRFKNHPNGKNFLYKDL